jgi:F0F1-type ATP synthase assembly protein I
MKQKFRTIVISVMAVIITLIAIYSFVRVSGAIDHVHGKDLMWKCFAIWIRSIILTQAVIVIGGLLLFMRRKPKGSMSR